MDTIKFWAVFAIGVAAGAAVALIYAPQTGAKTREQLKRKLDDASDYMKDVGGELGNRAGEAVSRGREAVGEMADSAQKATHDAARRVVKFTS